MALKKVCDQCGADVAADVKEAFDVVIEKTKGDKPERKIHLAIPHRLPQRNEQAHICPACLVSNLKDVIAQLSPAKK